MSASSPLTTHSYGRAIKWHRVWRENEAAQFAEFTPFHFPELTGAARYVGTLTADEGGAVTLRDRRQANIEYTAQGETVAFSLPRMYEIKTSGTPVYTMIITEYYLTEGNTA